MSYRYEDDYQEVPVKRPRAAAPSAKRSGTAGGSGRKVSPSQAQRAGQAQRSAPAAKRTAPAAGGRRSAAAPTKAKRYRDYDVDTPMRATPKRPPARKKARKRRTNPMLALLYWLLAIALAFGISYFVREYGFEIVRVSGDNMYETLMDGDLALVTKFDYQSEAPAQGDVVAVEMGGQKGVILRRVIGLPGDTVEIVDGETLINGSKLLEQYIGLATYDTFDGKTLPSGKYYLLGDNRTETNDSRDPEIGLVDREDIVGKVRWVIWPLSHLGSL